MIEALKADPAGWYEANKLDAAKVAGQGPKARERPDEHKRMMHQDMAGMAAMRQNTLWVHFLVITLSAWVLTSQFQYALFDPTAPTAMISHITQAPGL